MGCVNNMRQTDSPYTWDAKKETRNIKKGLILACEQEQFASVRYNTYRCEHSETPRIMMDTLRWATLRGAMLGARWRGTSSRDAESNGGQHEADIIKRRTLGHPTFQNGGLRCEGPLDFCQ